MESNEKGLGFCPWPWQEGLYWELCDEKKKYLGTIPTKRKKKNLKRKGLSEGNRVTKKGYSDKID